MAGDVQTTETPWETLASFVARPTVLRFGRGFFLWHRNDETQPFC
jgi:hypothetical protein